MDQSPATEPETPRPPYEAWRRFTLLDLMILFTGHEAALGIMKWHGLIDYDFSESDGVRIALRIIMLIFLFFLLGAIFSVPIVIAIQFFFRHRRAKLALGEILAVFTTIYWSIAFLLVSLFPYSLPNFDVIIAASLVAFLTPYFLLQESIRNKRLLAFCSWLNIYGAVIHFSSIVYLGFILILYRFVA